MAFNKQEHLRESNDAKIINNYKNTCVCTVSRDIYTISRREDINAIWHCCKCGGKTEKAGIPKYNPYYTMNHIAGE